MTCENPELAYRIGHPPEWWANEAAEGAGAAADIPPCQYFAPTPVGLEPGTDDLGGIAIRFDIGAGDTTPSGEVLTSRALAVDGRAAIAQEVEVPPQAGFVPEGSVAYRYLVELDSGETLMAIADNINVDQATYEDAIEVLDEMMETIEIGTPPA